MDSASIRWRPGAIADLKSALLNRPLLLLVFPFIVGVVLREYVPTPSLIPWILAAVSALGVVLCRRWRRGLVISAVLLAGMAGWLRVEVTKVLPEDHVSRINAGEKKLKLYGTVVTEPTWYTSARNDLDGDTRLRTEPSSGTLVVELNRIEETGPVSGRIKVNIHNFYTPLLPGDEIAFTARIKPFPAPSNPGQPDYRTTMERRGVYLSCSISHAGDLRIIERASPYSPMTWVNRIRSNLKEVATASLGPDAAGLITGLVLGYRDGVSDELNLSLQRTGTAHFLAISGLHLVLIYAVLAFVLYWCGVRRMMRLILLIALILFYTLLTGLQVSVVRSAIMILAYLVADLIWRPRDSQSALAASVWIILLADPFQLFEIGFQLSYLAVLGIIYVTPVIHSYVNEDLAETEHLTRFDRIYVFCLNYLKGGIVISLGAWILTAPLTARYFHIATPIVLIANLILAPLMSLLLIVGLLLLALGSVSTGLASPVGILIGWMTDALKWVSSQLAGVPYVSYVYVPDTPVLLTCLLFLLAGLWIVWYRLRPRFYKLAGVVVVVVLLSAPTLFRSTPREMRMAMLDVGKGLSMVIERPDGKTVVYDAGSLNYHDVTRSVIAPYLWSRGITHIDTLILSHSDADHINGAPTLIELFRPRQVLASHGISIEHSEINLDKTASMDDFPEWTVLAPPVWTDRRPDNDYSIALRLTHSAHSILLTGDLETPTIEYLLEHRAPLASEVIQLPHHGKMMEKYDLLAEAVRPKIALVSGPAGYYAEDVVQKYRALGSQVLITGLDGAIILHIDEQGIRYDTFMAR